MDKSLAAPNVDPYVSGDRPFRRADFQFSVQRLLIAVTVSAAILAITPTRLLGLDVALILVGVLLTILFNDWSAWRLVQGNAAMTAGNYRLALEMYHRALEARPDDTRRFYYRATARYTIGDLKGAREDLSTCMESMPPSARPFALLGWISVAERRHAEALAIFMRALALGDNDGSAALGLGFVWFQTGRFTDAIRQVEFCMREYPRDDVAPCVLAWFFATCREDGYRDGPRAMQIAQDAVRQRERPYVWGELSLAAAYAELGKFDEAVRHAEEAKRLAPPAHLDEATRFIEMFRKGEALREPIEIESAAATENSTEAGREQ